MDDILDELINSDGTKIDKELARLRITRLFIKVIIESNLEPSKLLKKIDEL